MIDANSEAAIHAIIEARAKGVRAGDVEALMADMADDVMTFDVVGPLCREGKALARERAARWLESYDEPPNWDNCDLKVIADGDVAFSYGLSHVTGTLKTGSAVDMWFRTTLGFRRDAGRWRIVHDHASVSFDPDNGKALLALKPEQGDENDN